MQQRFLLQILLRAQHVSGTTMPIIATVCLAVRSLRLIVCTSVHTSGHLNLRYLRSTTNYHEIPQAATTV